MCDMAIIAVNSWLVMKGSVGGKYQKNMGAICSVIGLAQYAENAILNSCTSNRVVNWLMGKFCSSQNDLLNMWNNEKQNKFEKLQPCSLNGIYGVIGVVQSDKLMVCIIAVNWYLCGVSQKNWNWFHWFAHTLLQRKEVSHKNVTPPTTKRHKSTEATMVADATNSGNCVQLPW